jgi:carbon storage regulator
MLVLSRKKSEQIQIGDHITITVLRVKGSAVQIGVDAPSHVKILRSELSFDPPAAPVANSASAMNASATSHDSPQIARLNASRDDLRLDDTRQFAPAVPHRDRVTLADTLVFLG